MKKETGGAWRVRSEFADQYEACVQRFLEHRMMLVHKGSGQPARKPEFLGARWCNKGFDKRNLFIHDSYVLFILNYHKSISVSHASRWPVRCLLPDVGELLVRALVLVTPLRRWLQQEVSIPEEVTEYLWASGTGIWSENKMTQVMLGESRATIGVGVHIQAWRQMAVGIASKKFPDVEYQADLDLPGGGRHLHKAGTVADVVHTEAVRPDLTDSPPLTIPKIALTTNVPAPCKSLNTDSASDSAVGSTLLRLNPYDVKAPATEDDGNTFSDKTESVPVTSLSGIGENLEIISGQLIDVAEFSIRSVPETPAGAAWNTL